MSKDSETLDRYQLIKNFNLETVRFSIENIVGGLVAF